MLILSPFWDNKMWIFSGYFVVMTLINGVLIENFGLYWKNEISLNSSFLVSYCLANFSISFSISFEYFLSLSIFFREVSLLRIGKIFCGVSLKYVIVFDNG